MNPHDALFKATFSQVEHVAGELRHVLPARLAARLDFSSLALTPGSFIDEGFTERHTDLLFTVMLAGRAALIYVLFEHQSSVDPLMPFRLLRYMIRIWEAWLKSNPDAKRLPPILPVVLHHSAGGWTAGTTFEGLLDLDAETLADLGEHAPRLSFWLDDVSGEDDEALQSRAMTALGRLVLWCFRNARTPDHLVSELGRWAGTMREVLAAPNGMAALALVFRYIFETNDRLGVDDLRKVVAGTVGEGVEEEVVTLANRLREEGRREGLSQGLSQGLTQGALQGRREALLDVLGARFGALPASVVARIEAADAAKLGAWLQRVAVAPTLADLLGDA